MDNSQADVKKLSFEDALKELQVIAEKLEKGDSPLQEAVNLYERGNVLKIHCEKLLKDAELKFEQLNKQTPKTPKQASLIDSPIEDSDSGDSSIEDSES